MSIKWELYCITEAAFKQLWSDEEPSECPENAEHEINPSSIHQVGESVPLRRVNINYVNLTSSYTKVCRFYNYEQEDQIRRIKAIAYSGSDTFYIRVQDLTNSVVLLEQEVNNTDMLNIVTLDDLDNVEFDTVIQIDAKVVGVSNNVNIDEIILYS